MRGRCLIAALILAATPAAAADAENIMPAICVELVQKMDACIKDAPNDQISLAFGSLKQQFYQLLRDNSAMAEPYCRDDLPNWQNCFGAVR